MTESLYASYSPVFRVGGERKFELARDLMRLEIEEATDGLRTLHAELIAVGPGNDPDEQQLYVDGAILDFGKKLEVSIGPDADQRIVFSGLVSAIEQRYEEAEPPIVAVFAEDSLMGLRMTRRCKTYENVSDADIAQAIAGEHGLSADTSADGPTYDVVQQMNQSDLAFLRERADRVLAEVWVSDDTLHFRTRDARDGTSISLVAGNDLLRVEARADLAHQRTKIRVTGYDAGQRAVIDEDADGSVVSREVTSGRSGPDVLQRAFGERVSHLSRQVALQSDEATAWAKAEMLRRARRFVQVRGVTRGTPDMTVGSRVEIAGVGAPFRGGGYYVTRVIHTYDLSEGMRTHFEAERPTLNEASS